MTSSCLPLPLAKGWIPAARCAASVPPHTNTVFLPHPHSAMASSLFISLIYKYMMLRFREYVSITGECRVFWSSRLFTHLLKEKIVLFLWILILKIIASATNCLVYVAKWMKAKQNSSRIKRAWMGDIVAGDKRQGHKKFACRWTGTAMQC